MTRFTPETKRQIAVLIDWLGSRGYAPATQAIMQKLSLSHEELASWRTTISPRG
jgi:hypothetical protein